MNFSPYSAPWSKSSGFIIASAERPTPTLSNLVHSFSSSPWYRWGGGCLHTSVQRLQCGDTGLVLEDLWSQWMMETEQAGEVRRETGGMELPYTRKCRREVILHVLASFIG